MDARQLGEIVVSLYQCVSDVEFVGVCRMVSVLRDVCAMVVVVGQ